MTGALGRTFIAAKYWNSFAVGAALCGFPIVVGENVVGIDKEAVIKNGKATSAPELDRRIDIFLRYYDGYGAIIVQMNVEDTRNGVAEYLIDKYGDKVIIELKWGQGAKDIGGEIQVSDIEYARFLKARGYVVDPDPTDPVVEKAFKNRAITSFARHSRLGGTDLDTVDAGAGSVHGGGGSAAKARLPANLAQDRLVWHGSAGDGHSLLGRCQAGPADDRRFGRGDRYESLEHDGPLGRAVTCRCTPGRTTTASCWPIAGSRPPTFRWPADSLAKTTSSKPWRCVPRTRKLVCMGRAPMIPGFLGSNIEGVFKPQNRAADCPVIGKICRPR